ncbi:MAG: autotransporter-associated beta strand repeat-containing protein [Chitinispirillia bacterium]|nr:autotransporter-associated beta strand repeat-containing protein [Chitinispirillia bacterium]
MRVNFLRKMAVWGGLVVVLGWGTAAAADGDGCEYEPEWCGGIAYSAVEKNVSGTVNHGYPNPARCIYVPSAAGIMNFNSDAGHRVNGSPAGYYTQAQFNNLPKKDQGYYIHLAANGWAQLSVSSGEPVCPNVTRHIITVAHGGTATGTTDPVPGDYSRVEGTSMTITATPAGTANVTWSGCPAGGVSANGLTCTINNITAPITVTANFNPPIIPIPSGFYAWNSSTLGPIVPVSGNWSANNRWQSGNSGADLGAWPVSGTNSALFTGTGTAPYNITAMTTNVAKMRFESAGYVIIAPATGTATLTVTDTIQVSGGVTADVNALLAAGTGGFRVAAVGSGIGTLVIGGTAANTGTGASFIGANTVVRAAKAGALGTGALTVTAANARLALAGSLPLSNSTVNIGTNHLTSAAGTANRITNAVRLDGGAAAHTITVDGALAIGGSIGPATGAGLIKAGAETLTLEDTCTYTGTTRVGRGTLAVGATATGGLSGPISLDSASSSVNFSRGGTAAFVQRGITGVGSVIKQGTSTLLLNAPATGTVYSGTTTISNGTIEVTDAAALGSGAVTVQAAGRLRLNHSGASDMNFTRAITGAGNTGTFEKTGTGTVNLITATSMTMGTAVVSRGTLNANYSDALNVDSVMVSSDARLGGTAQVGRSGARIRANGGTLSGTYYLGAVTLTGGGTLENVRTTPSVTMITGSLNLGSSAAVSNMDIRLSSSIKVGSGTERLFHVTGNLTLGGTLNITNPPTASTAVTDTGTYRIIQVGGTTSGAAFSAVTFAGSPSLSGFVCSTYVAGGYVNLHIKRPPNASVISNPLQVTAAQFVSEGAGGSVVSLTVTGFDALRGYLTGAPNVGSIYIYYRPGARAANWGDTTSAGGRIEIYPPSSGFPAAGNSNTFSITIPSAKLTAADTVYSFNAGVRWVVGSVDSLPALSTTPATSVYPRDPKRSVTANPLTISGAVATHTASGLVFNLTVSGQANAALTPGVSYKPGVDSVGIWIKRGDPALLPASLTSNVLARTSVTGATAFAASSLVALRGNGTFTYNADPVLTGNETFYFAVAPRWTGAGVDSIARPLYVTPVPVVSLGTPTPNNPCYLTAVQPDLRVPQVNIEVGIADGQFNEHASSVRVEFSFDPQMPASGIIHAENLTLSQVTGTAKFSISNNSFVGITRSVHYRIVVLDHTGAVETPKPGVFEVGRPQPPAPTGLVAEPNGGGMMRVRWNRVSFDFAANNIGDPAASYIWVAYSKDMPASNVDVSTMPGAVSVPATATETILSGLEYDTDYWFAAMVQDMVVGTVTVTSWNLKSPAAVISANSGGTDIVPNVVEITAAAYNESGSNFTVNYKLLQPAPLGTKLMYYVLYGEDTVARAASPLDPAGYTVNSTGMFNTVSLGAALQEGAVYHVYLYSINPEGRPAIGRSVFAVGVGEISSWTIRVAKTGNKIDTAYAFNGRLGFIADKWTIDAVCTLTVSQSVRGVAVLGIELLGEYGYEYMATGGAYLTSGLLDPFTIRIRPGDGDIQAPYTVNDVRIYRLTGSIWEVVHDTRYEGGYFTGTALGRVDEDIGTTYRLGISTQRPQVRIAATGAPVTGGSAQRPTVEEGGVIRPSEETYRVVSGIGNARAFMLVAPANNPSALTRIDPMDPPPLTTEMSVAFSIEDRIIANSVNYGLLMFLVVTDGHYTDTINVSRRVSSRTYTGFNTTPEARKWIPFAAQAVLQETAVKTHLTANLFASADEFSTYDTLFRLVRWDPSSTDATLKDQWVEYGNVSDSVFAMAPGRLMWIKTSAAAAKTFNYGAATTYSLIDTFTVSLPPGQWTDIVLPYTYGICLGDVLAATSANNLHFYRWKTAAKGKSNYITEQVAVVKIDSSYVLMGGDDPFTVYNNGNTAVTLRVPPRPALMSRHRPAAARKQMAKAREDENGLWYYSIRPSAQRSAEINEVLVGYAPEERTFPVPPTFSTESVVLVDEDGSLMGHCLSPAVGRGGKMFRLRFYNDERQRTVFKFTANPGDGVPAGTRAVFLNAATGAPVEASGGEYSVAVAGSSYEDIFMVVGGREYQAKTAVSPASKFKVAAVSVNQAARSVRLRYYVPSAGVDRVEVSVYDLKGRVVWKNIEKVRPGAWNTTVWNGRESRRGAGAGLYILRVRAVDGTGRTAAVDNRRVVFSR